MTIKRLHLGFKYRKVEVGINMLKRRLTLLLMVIALIGIMITPINTYAAELLDKHGIKELLKKADEAQYTLSEKHYSWDEALHTLTPYMTDKFATAFMDEHLFSEEEGYIFYGTDFSLYLIPRYAFNEKTKIVVSKDEKKIYIYEKFNGTGPVTFKDQYEVVTFVQENNQWKIDDISFLKELPDEIQKGSIIKFDIEDADAEDSESDESTALISSPYSKYIAVVPYFAVMQHSETLFAGHDIELPFLVFGLSNVTWEN